LMSSGGVAVQAELLKEDNTMDEFLHSIAMEMIRLSSEVFPIKFTFSPSLYNDLILHLRPMMNRIDYKISIKNPLLTEIKDEFPELMILLKLIVLKMRLKYQLAHISEDEISYLAVYFQAAIEEVISKKRVMIVCSTGVGTSHLLEKRVKNHFPEWHIVDVVSAKYLENMVDLSDVDLIISTVKLHVSLSKPVAYVSALFNKADEKRVRASFVNEEKKANVLGNFLRENESEKTGIYREILQAKVIERININSWLDVFIYEKEGLTNEVLSGQAAGQDHGKNKIKIIVLLKENAEFPESMLKDLYQLLISGIEN